LDILGFALPTVGAKKSLRIVLKVRLRYEKPPFELTALLNALRLYFHRTFIIPMPYLFHRIYYSDE